MKVGNVINRYKMGKHFELIIEERCFAMSGGRIRSSARPRSTALVSSGPAGQRSGCWRPTRSAHKQLIKVQLLLRTTKGIDRLVQPIRYRGETCVRVHVFLSVLAYYVAWHMRRALASLLFEDEELEQSRATRDPVAPTAPSDSLKEKRIRRRNADGHPIHSFETLLAELGPRRRNRCQVETGRCGPTFTQLTEPNRFQACALALLGLLLSVR